MPIVDDMTDFADPDTAPRPVIGFGVAVVTDGMELEVHEHRKAQLLLAMRGVLTCEAADGLWIVPPQCAIWIPGGVRHSVKGLGAIEGYCLLIEPEAADTLPGACCTLSVTPLLRELVMRCATFPVLYPEQGAEAHLVALLLDELAVAPIEKLYLPMPSDSRLRAIADAMTTASADRPTVEAWAARAGVSERTLSRIILKETGMSFGRWRQQFHIMLALHWLSKGAAVQTVASDLGYESAGSFVTMFKKALGSPPARYLARRRNEYDRRLRSPPESRAPNAPPRS